MEKEHTIKVLDHGFVTYVDSMGTDSDIAAGARTSYGTTESKGEEADRKLISYLYKNKHTSPFELIKIKFQIKLPIFVMRQYVRHRMQNLNEVSARYSKLPNEFYVPEENKWRVQATKNKQSSKGTYLGTNAYSEFVKEHCEDSYRLYENMLESGIAREMARMVLPLNIYTMIICTWDLKNLLHFISLRDDSHAQAEIQEYGKAIKSILVELFPWTMEVYEERNH